MRINYRNIWDYCNWFRDQHMNTIEGQSLWTRIKHCLKLTHSSKENDSLCNTRIKFWCQWFKWDRKFFLSLYRIIFFFPITRFSFWFSLVFFSSAFSSSSNFPNTPNFSITLLSPFFLAHYFVGFSFRNCNWFQIRKAKNWTDNTFWS